jgi:hypothetical protein
VRSFESGLVSYMHSAHPELCRALATGQPMSTETQDALRLGIEDFTATGIY